MFFMQDVVFVLIHAEGALRQQSNAGSFNHIFLLCYHLGHPAKIMWRCLKRVSRCKSHHWHPHDCHFVQAAVVVLEWTAWLIGYTDITRSKSEPGNQFFCVWTPFLFLKTCVQHMLDGTVYLLLACFTNRLTAGMAIAQGSVHSVYVAHVNFLGYLSDSSRNTFLVWFFHRIGWSVCWLVRSLMMIFTTQFTDTCLTDWMPFGPSRALPQCMKICNIFHTLSWSKLPMCLSHRLNRLTWLLALGIGVMSL